MPPLLPPSGQRWEEEVLAETVFRVILSDGKLFREAASVEQDSILTKASRRAHVLNSTSV